MLSGVVRETRAGVLEAVKDDLYRLTGETLSGGTVYSKVFGYDPVGNRQTQTTAGSAGSVVTPGVVNYGYDTRDRLLTENSTTYGYDPNGNLTTQSGFGTYTFDTENRLVRIAKSDGTLIEHAYDADGTRIRTKTTPPASPTQTTNFVVDTSGGLSHVVAEFNAAGIQTNYYLRALDDLLAVIRPTTTPGVFTTRYYHADGIGSIRKLTDDAGVVTDSYEYTAFGEQYEHIGTDPQPYSFAGEPLDPNTGFQYHRARWMQPSTGRFAGLDPWEGLVLDPPTLHKFQYARADPQDFVDPTGRGPSNFVFGNKVHRDVGLHFELSGPGRVSNHGGSFFFGPLEFGLGKLRPDLIDTINKQLFEIKTIREFAAGQAQLTLYLLIFNWADPDKSRAWTRGTAINYAPPNVLQLDTFGTYAIISPPVGGVIAYDVTNVPATIATLATVAVVAMSSLGGQLSAQFGVATQLAFSGAF